MLCVYLVEAPMENLLHFILIKRGFLDLSSGVLVVERDCFAGSWKEKGVLDEFLTVRYDAVARKAGTEQQTTHGCGGRRGRKRRPGGIRSMAVIMCMHLPCVFEMYEKKKKCRLSMSCLSNRAQVNPLLQCSVNKLNRKRLEHKLVNKLCTLLCLRWVG